MGSHKYRNTGPRKYGVADAGSSIVAVSGAATPKKQVTVQWGSGCAGMWVSGAPFIWATVKVV